MPLSKNVISGSIDDIINQISQSKVGSHNILIHPHMEVFREVYTGYIKRLLKEGDGIVLILPYYETEEKVREILSESFGHISNEEVELGDRIEKYEKEGSLIIKDSLKAYSSATTNEHANNDTAAWSLIQELVKRAENSSKSGVTVFADLASFYHYDLGNTKRLLSYESSLPKIFVNGLKLKGLCVYHKRDFEKRLTEEEKQKILKHHSQVFIVQKEVR